MRCFAAWCPTTVGCGHEAAHQLLPKLYTAVTGDPMPPLHRQERGKPYWPDSPWHLSIAHTDHIAFCVLADVPIGIDAEPLDRRIPPALAGKVLSSAELAAWKAQGESNRDLITFWTLKEAALKYSGEGLRGYPNHLSFRLDPPRLEGSDLFFAIRYEENHVLSLCTPELLEDNALHILKF